MGGKSSSSSTTQTTTTQEIFNDTKQADASGVIGGNVLQGEITYIDEFGEGVGGAFNSLINLANTAITGAALVVTDSIDQSNNAIVEVAKRAETADNPDLATQRANTPIIMAVIGASVLVGVFYIWRRNK